MARIDAKIIQFQLNRKIFQTPKSAFESLANSLEFLLLSSKHWFFHIAIKQGEWFPFQGLTHQIKIGGH